MAIQLKRPAEVEGLREAGRIVAGAFDMLRGQGTDVPEALIELESLRDIDRILQNSQVFRRRAFKIQNRINV